MVIVQFWPSGGWVVGCAAYVSGGNQYENNATSWSNLQDCKISSKAEIPKLDPSVAKLKRKKEEVIDRDRPCQ